MGMATSRQTLLDGATVRNIFTGHAGHMGLMAARPVECGFTGEKDSPAAIYGKVLADGFDPAEATGRPRPRMDARAGLLQAAPDRALRPFRDRRPGGRSFQIPPLGIARIDRIEVKACRLAAMLKEKRVTSSFGARFSVPFALATILSTAERTSRRSSRPRSSRGARRRRSIART